MLRTAALGLAPLVAARRQERPLRVLLVRPDHVGDVLLTAPAIATLRASLPDARLTYLVGPWGTDAAQHGPPVDELRTLPFPGFTRRANANLVAPYVTLMRAAAQLRRERYDLAVIFRPDHWWGALLTLAAGIPLRVGSQTPETAPLLTHTCAPAADEPATHQALAIARLALDTLEIEPACVGDVVQYVLTDTARAAAENLLASLHLDGRNTVVIHPSAGAPLKSWPVTNWARLADALIDAGQAVLLTGAPVDAALLEAIATQMRHVAPRACGQPLEVSAALYARCALVVTVDSGAGHLAAAVGAPTLRLYGPAPPSIFGPWPPTARQHVLISDELACVPCGNLDSPPCGARTTPACLLALSVEAVLKAIGAELARG